MLMVLNWEMLQASDITQGDPVQAREMLVMLTPAECARLCLDLGLLGGRLTSGGQTVQHCDSDTLDTRRTRRTLSLSQGKEETFFTIRSFKTLFLQIILRKKKSIEVISQCFTISFNVAVNLGKSMQRNHSIHPNTTDCIFNFLFL